MEMVFTKIFTLNTKENFKKIKNKGKEYFDTKMEIFIQGILKKI